MATDYYKPISNAVSRLRPNTLAARRSIYDQARQLLFEEAQQSDPPMSVSELIHEQRALEDAIQMVEAEATFNENADAVRDEEPVRRTPVAQAPAAPRPRTPMHDPRGLPERARVTPEPAPSLPPRRPAPVEETYYDDEPAYEPTPRERREEERLNRLREQEQRRLEADQRRAQRHQRPRAARPQRPASNSSAVVVVAIALFALFLAGGAGAYVMIYGWPSLRTVQQPQQQKKKQETPPETQVDTTKLRDLMERASKALEGGDPTNAIQLLTEAIVLSPKEAGAYTLRGHSYLQTGDAQRAVEDFSEAIKLGSRDFYAFVGRAVAYRRIRDFPRSIADYNEAIKIRPEHAGAWNNRCFVQAIAGDLDAALADCNESLRLVANEPNTLDSRALVYLKQGKWDLAIADYDEVLKIAPNTVSALYGRGYAKLKKGDKRGQADIATATTAAPTIAQEFERYGVK